MCKNCTLLLLVLILGLLSEGQYKTNAQQLITNEDSLNANASKSKTVVSGYGSAFYQRDFNLKQSIVTLERAVLFVGHQFNQKISLFTELEVENAKVEGGEEGGEIAMEQAFVKFNLNPKQYIVAGLFVPRIGLLNENHLPVNFNGVERPMVEQLIIPATWREIGVGFYGSANRLPLNYTAALMNGLNGEGFEHGSGIREGRAEGKNALANNLALTASLQYFINDFKFQVSGYMSGTVGLNRLKADSLGLNSGAFGTPLYLGEADAQYSKNGFAAKAIATFIAYPESDKINAAYANNAAKTLYGAYAEMGFDWLYKKQEKAQLITFARCEVSDLNASVPANGIYDGTLKQIHIIAGISYLPIPNVVVKADVRLLHTGPQNPALIINPAPNALPYQQNNQFLNIGIGYSFLITMERREFIQSSCNTCLLVAAGYLLPALAGCSPKFSVFKTDIVDKKVSLPLTMFQQSSLQFVRPNGWAYDIAVQKKDDATYNALLLQCTHQENQLTADGNGFHCNLHGSQFDKDGNVRKGPAELPLKKYQTSLDKNNVIIQIPKAPQP